MSNNDIIILNSILDQEQYKSDVSADEQDLFQRFAIDQVLKDYDLSYEDMASGIIDKGDDGGIDALYFFINRDLLCEDTDLSSFKKRNPLIECIMIQTKNETSFGEKALLRITSSSQDIFDLSKDIGDLSKVYNKELIAKVDKFRESYKSLAHNHPKLVVSFYYITKGETDNIHLKVRELSESWKKTVITHFRDANVQVHFWGAVELIDASRKERSYTLQLDFLESPLSRRENNYVVFAYLRDFFRFMTDESGNLRRYIFESNVRDYQGSVEVNKDIAETLESNENMDFWWLNNGITIIASEASIAGKTISLDNVQIVNGLQTATEIYEYFSGMDSEKRQKDDRSLLIRVIVTDDSKARDRIIKATNFQTAVPVASLKATDKIQRDIETFFLNEGLYYDRRKNFYKNQGKPASKIVGIPYLAQAVMAIVLREPDNARARPSSLIKRDNDYRRVFDENLPAPIYLFCAQVMKKIDAFVRTDNPSYSVEEITNLKFHLAMAVTISLANRKDYTSHDLSKLSINSVTDQVLETSFGNIVSLARTYSSDHNSSIDKLAKSRGFLEYLLQEINVN